MGTPPRAVQVSNFRLHGYELGRLSPLCDAHRPLVSRGKKEVQVRKALSRCGFYRLVWHRALFDVPLFLVLTGVVSVLATDWIGQ
jgi:Protein of unknown function (DUF1656)